MIRQLRQILPSASVMISCLVIFLTLEAPMLYAELRAGMKLPNDVNRAGAYLLLVLSAIYGVYRVVAFHPFYQSDYRKWLELTPWNRSFSLPLGPANLIWADAIVLGALSLPSLYLAKVEPARLCGNTLLFGSGALALTFWSTGVPAFGYAVALLAGLAVRLSPDRWAYLAAASATYVVAYAGLWRSLGLFPWGSGWAERIKFADALNSPVLDFSKEPSCGWPYDLLRPPKPSTFRLDFHDAMLSSMLVGWWVFALLTLCFDPADRPSGAVFAWFLGTIMLVFGRFIRYRNGYAPPVSLLTRLMTRRYFIPAYDQIYIAPVCAGVVGGFTPKALVAIGLQVEAAFPTGLALVMLIVLTAKPSLIGWRLTGGHRIAFPLTSRQDNTKFVRVG